MKIGFLIILCLMITLLLFVFGCQSNTGDGKQQTEETPPNLQTQTATPSQTMAATESASPEISNVSGEASGNETSKKQPYIKGTGFEITQEDLVKLDANLTDELSKLVVKNKDGEATFVLGMTARDMVNEYCKIEPNLKKDKNKHIDAFEHDPIIEYEEPPSLGGPDFNSGTITVLYNRSLGWIISFLNDPYNKETHQLGPIMLETATPQDIINLLGNPQQIGTGPESEPFMVYNLDKGEKVLNLRFLFDGNTAEKLEMYIYDKNEFLHWLKDNSRGIKPDP